MTWRNGMGAGVITSVVLHLVVGAVLFVEMPSILPAPEVEQSVAVELVPPPEAADQEQSPPEEEPEQEQDRPPAEPPEEAEAEAPAPKAPPPSEEEQATEQPETPAGAPEEPPPPEETAEIEEQAAASPPPPPPPPPPSVEEPEVEEQAAATPPPPPPPAEQETVPEAEQAPSEPPAAGEALEQAEQQPSGGEGQGQQALPVLRPVFEFGEEDGGPRIAEDGNSSADEAEKAGDGHETDEGDDVQAGAADAQSAEDGTEVNDPAATETPLPETEVAAGNPVPSDVQAPSVDFGGTSPVRDGAGGAADDGKAGILAAPAGEDTQEPTETAAAAPPLKEAKRLFSQNETDDIVATTAMSGIPRDIRAGQLCATELREQLVRATPRYRPEMLPSYKLPRGTVMDARKAAFRSDGQWYELQFRCELNETVTKVTGFAFEVGEQVPRSQWAARRFPSF